jgi:hypothetical protein
MRGYTEAVPRRQRLANRQVSGTVCSLEGDLVAVHDNRYAAGQPG